MARWNHREHFPLNLRHAFVENKFAYSIVEAMVAGPLYHGHFCNPNLNIEQDEGVLDAAVNLELNCDVSASHTRCLKHFVAPLYDHYYSF